LNSQGSLPAVLMFLLSNCLAPYKGQAGPIEFNLPTMNGIWSLSINLKSAITTFSALIPDIGEPRARVP